MASASLEEIRAGYHAAREGGHFGVVAAMCSLASRALRKALQEAVVADNAEQAVELIADGADVDGLCVRLARSCLLLAPCSPFPSLPPF